MVKVIFIDFFGVIFPDTLNEWMAYRQVEDVERVHAISDAADRGRISTETFFTRIGATTGIDPATVRTEFQRFETPDQRVVELIERLRMNYPVVLISNSSSEYLRGHLRAHELERLFDHILISGELGYAKPDPEIYQEALQRTQALPREAVFLDDRLINVEGAAAVGVNAAVFVDVKQAEQDLAKFGVKVA